MATLALSLLACGEVDIVDHDPLLAEPEGNLEEARERCGPLPPDVGPIPELMSAWAMGKVPVKDGEVSVRAATSSMVLRLSNDAVPCGVVLEPEPLGCPAAWSVDVTLRNASLGPGAFALGDHAQGYHLATAQRVDRACDRELDTGTFAAGRLEIFTVTDECVVGRLVDTADDLEASGATVEGGFVALRCELEE